MDTRDWYEAETPLHVQFFRELDRLRRRARPRWWLVVLVGVVLTVALVRKISSKPPMHRARVILAISEGDLNSGWNPAPLGELRAYISTVLLSNERILALLDERQLFTGRRARFGDEFVIESVRDDFEIEVWRNYFQYGYDADDRRTARVMVSYTSKDPAFSYDMARALAHMIQEAEADRRTMAAFQLAEQAADIERAARQRLDEIGQEQRAMTEAIDAAEAAGDHRQAAILRAEAGSLTAQWQAAITDFESIEAMTSKEALEAAITSAGLALDIQIVDERRPPPIEPKTATDLIPVAIVGLVLFLPLAGVLIGAFDTRVHDVDDVTRLGLPMLGHVPTFPGDRVGALQDRGVPRRRAAS